MLDDVGEQLLAWLKAQPSLPAVEALSRLQAQHPERFGETQLRTLQRFMRAQRGEVATRLVSAPLSLQTITRATDDTKLLGNISA